MRLQLLAFVALFAVVPAGAGDSPVVREAAGMLDKEPAGAVALATTALSAKDVTPSDAAGLHAVRGKAHLALKEYEAAVADLSAAIDSSLPPKDNCTARGNLFVSRGNAYLELMRHRLAAADFLLAAECEPDNVDIEVKLAEAYFYFDREKTRDVLTAALKMRPNDVVILLYRARNYENMDQNQLAIDDFTKVIELDPKQPRAHNDRATAYTNISRYPEAIADYDQEIALEPEEFMPYVNRADLKFRLHEYRDARADLEKAKALYADPKHQADFARKAPPSFVKKIESDMASLEQFLNDAPQ